MLHRVIYNADDSVIIMSPNPNTRLKGETEAEQLERFYLRHLESHSDLDGLNYEDMDTSALPSDRTKRDKWRKKPGGGILVDDSVITSNELRTADKVALQAERDKPVPNMKVALDLLLKLQENNY